MQVAVAHVAEGADLQVEGCGRIGDEPTIVASSLRGTVTSSRIVVGRRRASAANALRRAPASCSASASSRAVRTSRAPMRARDRFHLRGFVRDGRRMAVGFHEQHGFAIGRQADVREILDAAGRHLVEKLQRAGNDPRRDDGGDGLGGVLDADRRARASSAAPPAAAPA